MKTNLLYKGYIIKPKGNKAVIIMNGVADLECDSLKEAKKYIDTVKELR